MSGRLPAIAVVGVLTIVACSGTSEPRSGRATASSVPTSAVPDDRLLVLPQTSTLSLLDAEVAPAVENTSALSGRTFTLAGSPDDDADGDRVQFGFFDATGVPFDDVQVAGTVPGADGRSFSWSIEGEGQQLYLADTPLGTTMAMATLNLDQPSAIGLLEIAELTGDDVSFGGQPVPDGWIDTGSTTTQSSFVGAATGSSTPSGGRRSLYGDPARSDQPTWDDIRSRDFGLTLSTWPVATGDPDNEARYNLDGEIEVDVPRADGSTRIGFTSPTDTEFLEFVVYRDGQTWVALSRSTTSELDSSLIDLAATVRSADPSDFDRFKSLSTD